MSIRRLLLGAAALLFAGPALAQAPAPVPGWAEIGRAHV